MFWRRSTKYGALACVLTVVVLWTYFFTQGWGNRAYTVGDTGLMAVAVILAASSLAMIVGSLLTAPPEDERVNRFIPRS